VNVLSTDRLTLRHIEFSDAEFVIELLNQPSFIQFIGDRRVRTVADAHAYISKAWQSSYATFGFGMYLTSLTDGTPIGICGLVKRETLDDVDIGFAFIPAYWGQGYAVEAAAAVLGHAQADLGLRRVVAIANPDNASSIKLLERLGMVFERPVRLTGDSSEISLYGRAL